MAMMGEDDIQGKKHTFLSGNHVYYVGAIYLVQQLHENETIGLAHPFHNDLRSRGLGYACYDGVGCGNDYRGWEFYRTTKVAKGSVLADGERWQYPAPKHMYWRPDKVIVEYELTSPYLQGDHPGWCPNWVSAPWTHREAFFSGSTRQECWDSCNADARCEQAVWEGGNAVARSACWLGVNTIAVDARHRPSRSSCRPPGCENRCYAKGRSITPINIREEKFISANDVVTTIMTSDRPVTLEVSGHSLKREVSSRSEARILEQYATCAFDPHYHAVHVVEGGRAKALVTETGSHDTGHGGVDVNGTLMYDGMSAIIATSRPMANTSITALSPGVCAYSFTVSLDGAPTALSWAMDMDYNAGMRRVQKVLASPALHKQAKTDHMNDLLNRIVPYFRCSDQDIVRVYYFLWSIFLMYYKQGDRGMEIHPHTQSAVHNFLGMHRFDAVFQIIVGSWTNPTEHAYYANGNVLSWNMTLPFRRRDQLPDNFGIGWTSNLYGPEVIAHVIGAYQIYEHSGNTTFLTQAYQFYKTLYWNEIRGKVFGYAWDAVLCLNKMATILGMPEDAVHWNATINMPYFPRWLANNWEADTPNYFGRGRSGGGVSWDGVAVHGLSMYPREYALRTANYWLDDSVRGFSSEPVGLNCVAKQNWSQPQDPRIIHAYFNFAVTPDANWYLLRGLYLKQINRLANKFTLNHLKRYNMEWFPGAPRPIPVAPEARRMNSKMHGDQYSNFNAGKILLVLEGIGGLKYSTHEDTFTYADSLPTNWTFMEFNVPVKKRGEEVQWVRTRSERREVGGRVIKSVIVENNPFTNLVVQPWAEDATTVQASPAGYEANPPVGHVSYRLQGSSANVELTLDP